jgi:hypothetical protein
MEAALKELIVKNIWVISGILGVNTAFALQTLSLAPGSKAVIEAATTTEVRCQGAATSTAQPCTPVADAKDSNRYQLKIGERVHPGIYPNLYDVSYAMKTLKESGICQ